VLSYGSTPKLSVPLGHATWDAATPAAARGLLLREENAALGFAPSSGFHGGGVGRSDAEVVMNARGEERPAHQRPNDIRQQQIGDGLQLVARRRMPGDANTQLAQVLDGTPNFRARRTQLLRNARPADDQRRVVT